MKQAFKKHLLVGVLSLGALAPALADEVRVELTGSVDYNLIRGGLSNVKPGDRAVMSFTLDSNNYLNSATFPTRGYRINPDSFSFTVGGVALTLITSADAPLFVLRNNDPGVDGFFLSRGTDLASPLGLNVPGLPAHELQFSRSFNNGNALASVNILDAVGTYGSENMGSYLWSVGRFGTYGMEVAYESLSITAVPEPSSYALMLVGALGLLALKRKRRADAAASCPA